MRRAAVLAGLVTLLALIGHPTEAQRSIMNFADILNRPMETFRVLCRHDGHLNDTGDRTTLQCLTPEREPDFIIALYEGGKAERWGAKFPSPSKAYELKRMFASSYGPPARESAPDEDGCITWAWAPDTSSLIYLVARCPRSTMFIVQFQPGK